MKTKPIYAIVVFFLHFSVPHDLFSQITNNFYCTNAVQMLSGTNYMENTSIAPPQRRSGFRLRFEHQPRGMVHGHDHQQ